VVPEERWPSVDVMLEAFRDVRRTKLDEFTSTRPIALPRAVHEDGRHRRFGSSNVGSTATRNSSLEQSWSRRGTNRPF
jgi:hypothetical protein